MLVTITPRGRKNPRFEIFVASRQRKHDARASATFARLDPDSSLVRFDDSLRDREAHPGAARLACRDVAVARGPEELVKHALAQIFRYARTVVFHGHLYQFVAGTSSALFVDHFHHLYSRVAIECSGKFAAADFVEQCRDRSLDGSERRA